MGVFRNSYGSCSAASCGDWPEVMAGIFARRRTGAIAIESALSAAPNTATYPPLAILCAMSVVTVGSPWSSKRVSTILRPPIPPRALACLTASLTPSYSQCPSELSCPLWASTTAILIGPEPLLPPEDELDPGAPQAEADSASASRAALAP